MNNIDLKKELELLTAGFAFAGGTLLFTNFMTALTMFFIACRLSTITNKL